MTVLSERAHDRPATPHELIRFHARHKLLLMAHAPAAVTALGRLVARAGTSDLGLLWDEYMRLFQSTIATPPSRGGHVNALSHAVGYFRGVLDDDARRQLVRTIEQYAAGATNLATPVRLIRQHAADHGVEYLRDQVYLQLPSPPDER
jgi:uncharacterized protein YbgA (DUF1722 family)